LIPAELLEMVLIYKSIDILKGRAPVAHYA
jgi:hypothetical protein